jgi:putative spermidine/putrescine transport system ATP-binding protein
MLRGRGAAMSSATGFSTMALRGIARTYPKSPAPALVDFDLEIGRGEFVALLGPSGCGKSTALACLAGLQPLSAGSIWRDAERIDTLLPERRGFGMVFQSYALFPHLTVRQNVAFGLRMRHVPKATREARADEMLALVKLEQHADKLPSQLSGGQQQRVAIARALAIDPQVVLMDEPLSNLDAALRVEMRTEIKRLHQKRELTILYVTHDQEEALSLATRIVVLRAGRIEQDGTPADVHDHPASPYVAGFMGFRNLLPGVAGRVHDGAVAIHIDGIEFFGTPAVGPIEAGRAAVLAIRPEDVRLGAPEAGAASGTVEVVEYLGRQRAVELRLGHDLLLHVVTDAPVAAGETVGVSVDPRRALAFASDAAQGGRP